MTYKYLNSRNDVAIFRVRNVPEQGRIQDFKLGGAHLTKLRRTEGGAKILGVFRVKNHNFTPKNLIFSNFKGRAPSGSAPAEHVISLQDFNIKSFKAQAIPLFKPQVRKNFAVRGQFFMGYE
jgi:hypothetical protein